MLLNTLFLVLCFSWIAEFVLFPSKKTKHGKKSFNLILLTTITSITLSLLMPLTRIANIRLNAMPYLGIVFLASGVMLRYWSILTLGNNFTRGITSPKNQELLKTGPYSKLRHPLYLGLFFITLGFSVFTSNIISISLTTILMFFSLQKRMNTEETYLTKKIGRKYVEWKQKRYKFIPFLH